MIVNVLTTFYINSFNLQTDLIRWVFQYSHFIDAETETQNVGNFAKVTWLEVEKHECESSSRIQALNPHHSLPLTVKEHGLYTS